MVGRLGWLVGWSGLVWFGLVWLGWVGLGWVGLGWVGLGWVGLGWVGLVGWLVGWLVVVVSIFLFSRLQAGEMIQLEINLTNISSTGLKLLVPTS